MKMELDLRTEQQKKVAQRAERVCVLYRELRKNSIGSNTAIWRYIAEQVSAESKCRLTPIGVRSILIRKKLYVPKK